MTHGAYLKEVGQRIKAIRKSKKLSLRQFGDMCEVDFGSLSRIENGLLNSSLTTLKSIAEKLEVDVKELL